MKGMASRSDAQPTTQPAPLKNTPPEVQRKGKPPPEVVGVGSHLGFGGAGELLRGEENGKLSHVRISGGMVEW